MHLLGVKSVCCEIGSTRLLFDVAIRVAKQTGFSKILLWTKKPMGAVQQLYLSCGLHERQKMIFFGMIDSSFGWKKFCLM